MFAALIVFFLFFCNGAAFADNVTTNTVVQGNQGYVYGTPPKADATADDNSVPAPNPIKGIVNAVDKLDAWIRENLW